MNLVELKEKLSVLLPEKIGETVETYEVFSNQEVPMEAKAFAAHHAACKSAMAHVDTLIKLLRWCEITSEKSEAEANAELLAEARAALSLMEDEEDE